MAETEGLSSGAAPDVAAPVEMDAEGSTAEPEAGGDSLPAGDAEADRPMAGEALRRLQMLEQTLDGVIERLEETRKLLAALLWSVDAPVTITPEAFSKANARDVDITSSLSGGRTTLSIRGRVYIVKP